MDERSPYGLKAPCDDCPFLRDGGVRLMRGRITEIAGNMLDTAGGEFHCHKTTIDGDEDEDGCEVKTPGPQSMHCAGALIFAGALVGHDRVFDDIDEMLATALDARPARRWGKGSR